MQDCFKSYNVSDGHTHQMVQLMFRLYPIPQPIRTELKQTFIVYHFLVLSVCLLGSAHYAAVQRFISVSTTQDFSLALT